MNKKEIRQNCALYISAAGDVELEKAELLKIQCSQPEDMSTITVSCTELLTILCC